MSRIPFSAFDLSAQLRFVTPCFGKVLETFGCVTLTTETLDEFRYVMMHSVPVSSKTGASVQRLIDAPNLPVV
ncbi:MAG: hypothetical protein NTY15_13855 [Planctomycetota bacterium]|nr:hypothetical protein [Planctomycetota bacterium]